MGIYYKKFAYDIYTSNQKKKSLSNSGNSFRIIKIQFLIFENIYLKACVRKLIFDIQKSPCFFHL